MKLEWAVESKLNTYFLTSSALISTRLLKLQRMPFVEVFCVSSFTTSQLAGKPICLESCCIISLRPIKWQSHARQVFAVVRNRRPIHRRHDVLEMRPQFSIESHRNLAAIGYAST